MIAHEIHITAEKAWCTCRRMPVMLKPSAEHGGAFTLRAYAAWETHKACIEELQQAPLFAFDVDRQPVAPVAGMLFGNRRVFCHGRSSPVDRDLRSFLW